MSLFNAVHYVPTYNSIPFGHNSRKDFYSWAGIWYSVKCNNLCCSSVLKWTISKCHSQSLHFYFLPSRSLSFVLPFPPFFCSTRKSLHPCFTLLLYWFLSPLLLQIITISPFHFSFYPLASLHLSFFYKQVNYTKWLHSVTLHSMCFSHNAVYVSVM